MNQSIHIIKALTSNQRVMLYNALTKKDITKFATLEKGIAQCLGAAKAAGEEAVLAALKKLPAHKKAAEPAPAPVAVAQPAPVKAEAAPAVAAPKTGVMAKIERLLAKPAAPVVEKKTGGKITTVKPTFKGTSKVQAGSVRAKVLTFIQFHHDGVEVAKISEHIGSDARGYVQKLLEKNHVEVIA